MNASQPHRPSSSRSLRVVIVLLISLLIASASPAAAQPAFLVQALLDDAAARFDVPRDLLYGISYATSRWADIPADSLPPACSGLPPAYGIMGLHDDDYFGHGLSSAGAIGITPQDARTSMEKNILAGAYHIATLFDGTDRTDFRQWLPAIGRYSGIPEEPLRLLYTDGVLRLLSRGWTVGNASVRPRTNLPTIDGERLREELGRIGIAAGADYPGAQWQPSPNYSSRNGRAITAITIHDTEGEFAGSLSWLRNTASEASAHYIVRSVDGMIVQMVSESAKAWHVRDENPYTIGIEHEGFAARPEYYTQAMYKASAGLTRYLIDKYHIPLDRSHVKGHIDFPNNTHTDPGGWWDWPGYYRLIARTPSARVVIDPFEENVVGWWQPSLSGSTIGTDADATRFSVAARGAYTGSGGGELSYGFTGASGGVARVFRSGHGNTSDGLLNVGSSGALTLAVKGDGSGHELELWLYDNAKGNHILDAGPITWSGWRTVSVPLNGLGASGGPYRFHSIVLRQGAGKARTGTIAFDDLAHETALAGVDQERAPGAAITGRIALAGSTPMPETLRALGAVSIYAAAGEEIVRLDRLPDAPVSGYLAPGIYLLRFASGAVYLTAVGGG